MTKGERLVRIRRVHMRRLRQRERDEETLRALDIAAESEEDSETVAWSEQRELAAEVGIDVDV